LTSLIAAGLLLWFFRMRAVESPAHEQATAPRRASPLRDRVFVAFLGLMLLYMMALFQFGTNYPLYLRDHYELSKPLIGLMFTVNTSLIVILEMLVVDSTREWRPLPTIGFGSLVLCLGFGILPFGSSGAYCVLAMFIATLGEMYSLPLATGFVGARTPRGSEAMYMGWYTVMMSMAYVLAPSIGSTIYAIDHDALWICVLAIGVLTFIGFQLLARREAREEPRAESIEKLTEGEIVATQATDNG
jgi:predicted MFS family arabinose efflux permease